MALLHHDGGSLRVYAEMVTSMDQQVGRVLETLEKLGLAEHTRVVFTSDNGGERFSDTWPFSGRKTELLEGGIRVPTIVRWPGRIRERTVSDAQVMSMDWMPTILAAAGVPAQLPFDGLDVAAALRGGHARRTQSAGRARVRVESAPFASYSAPSAAMTADMPRKIALRTVAFALMASLSLLTTGCGTLPDEAEEREPVYVPLEAAAPEARDPVPPPPAEQPAAAASDESSPEPTVAEPRTEPRASTAFEDVIVKAAPRGRHEEIRDLVAEAKALLRDVELKFVFTGKGRRETLRGRPVAFALWSESSKQWTVAHVEIPRPPIKWKPGGRPLPVTVLTPGITARHVKGTGAERLMFAFSKKDGEPLKVYGRKFPIFDNAAVDRKRWRAAVATARPIIYLPFTEDTLDPLFVQGGREFLLATANKAIEELRTANAPSRAFPGRLLADVVPAELITALAVIEQTDDLDYSRKRAAAFDDVLSQYGLKREEAYRYSVSRARAIGAMQFTNRRGNGTYSAVVRLCPAARLDPVFERGATDLLNSMKAAICLFDIELSQMAPQIRNAYWDNKRVLGIFPVAAYNGGPRNVAKLHRVIQRMQLSLEDLRPPGELPPGSLVACPCLWAADGADGIRPVSIPKYNNENRWYVQKYQTLLSLFEK